MTADPAELLAARTLMTCTVGSDMILALAERCRNQACHTSFRSLRHAQTRQCLPHIRSRLPERSSNGMRFDAAIHLQFALWVARVQQLAKLADLAQRITDELLSAKPRIDAHHQHEVELFQDVVEHVHRRGRANRLAAFFPICLMC